MARRSREEVCGNTSQNGQKIFVSHVNAHQSVTSTEEDFDNQFYRVTHFGYTSQPLSPGSCIIAQWAQKQNGHDGRLCMGSVTGFHSQRLPDLIATAE